MGASETERGADEPNEGGEHMTSIREIIDWLKSLWAKPVPIELVKEEVKEPKGNTPKRKYNKERSKTLSDLLDNLEYTFGAMKIDYQEMSFIDKKEVEGLKKFGVSVIPNSLRDVVDNSNQIDKEIKLPTIIFLAHTDGVNGDKKIMCPDFFFAIKEKKCPWYVAKKTGVIYNCGFGYRDVTDNKIFWVSFYVSIKDSEVLSTHYLAHKTVKTPKASYTKKEWQLSSWKNFSDEENNESTVVTSMVAHHFNLWGSRRTMWSTTVERDEHRAIFYVDHRDTKTFFKNREKTVTENGYTKRIIHLVEEHERKNSSGNVSVVSEHVRGENKFLWNGFKCSVASPVHHLDVRRFSAASETRDDDDREGFVDFPQMAEMLHSKSGVKLKDLHREVA
jgi:hypothetical protein